MPTSTPDPSVSTGDLIARLAVVRTELNTLVRAVDPKSVELSEAVGLWSAFTGLARLANAGALLLSARAAEARAAAGRGAGGRGAGGPADQAARDAGTSTGRARAEAEASKRLEGLDATAEELRAGRLSPEQAGAIADAAATNPDCEADLIELAQRESLRKLKEEAARRKAERDDLEAHERTVRKERSARSWVKDGRWNFYAHGPITDGVDLDTALRRLVADHYNGRATPDADREPREAYAFDALIDLARRAMRGTPSSGGDTDRDDRNAGGACGAGGAGGGDAAATRNRERPNRMAILRIDLPALQRGEVGDGEVCEIVGFGPISVAAARDMLGDCLLKAVLTHGTKVAGVVHLNRVPTLAQQLALLWMSPACTTEGCDNDVAIEIDHRVDWAITRQTLLEELEHGCKPCHDLKTYQGWALVAGTGRRPLVPPDDARHPLNDPTHPDHPRLTAAERRTQTARARQAARRAAADRAGRAKRSTRRRRTPTNTPSDTTDDDRLPLIC